MARKPQFGRIFKRKWKKPAAAQNQRQQQAGEQAGEQAREQASDNSREEENDTELQQLNAIFLSQADLPSHLSRVIPHTRIGLFDLWKFIVFSTSKEQFNNA